MSDDYTSDITTTAELLIAANTPAALTGIIEVAGDTDWFKITLQAGQTVRLDLEGSPTGQGTLTDTVLTGVYDAQGQFIAGTTNDDGGVDTNSSLVFTASTAGDYFIEAAAFGNEIGDYRVQATTVQIVDDFSQNASAAGFIEADSNITGNIDFIGDKDWFRIDLQAGESIQIDLEGAETNQGSLADTLLGGLYNALGELIAGTENDDGGVGTNSLINFTADVAGPYYIEAGAFGDNTGSYRLQVMRNHINDDFENTIATTGTIALGETISANIEYAGDKDWFKISLLAGQEIRLDAEGSITDQGTLNDTFLYGIYDANGNLVSKTTADDDSGVGTNSRVSFTASTDGDYYISAGAYGDATGSYSLTARFNDDFSSDIDTLAAVTVDGGSSTGNIDASGDTDWFRVVLDAGQHIQVELEGAVTGQGSLEDAFIRGIFNAQGQLMAKTNDDDSGVGRNARVDFIAEQAGEYFIAAGAYANAQGSYSVTAHTVHDDFDNTSFTTGVLDFNGFSAGEIEVQGDTDWFKVSLVAGQQVQLNLEGIEDPAGGMVDTFIRGVFNADGNQILEKTSNDDGGQGTNSQVVFTAPVDGDYFVSAGAYGATTGAYQLRIQDVSINAQRTPLNLDIHSGPVFGTVAPDDTLIINSFVSNPETTDIENIILQANDTIDIDVDGMHGVQRYESNNSQSSVAINDIRLAPGQVTEDITLALTQSDPSPLASLSASFDQYSLRASENGLVTSTILLDDVGRNATGGRVTVGSLAPSTDAIGIDRFNVTVENTSHLSALRESSGQLRELQIMNGQTPGDLTIDETLFDLRVIDAGQMQGAVDLSVNLTANIAAKFMDRMDTDGNPKADNEVNGRFMYLLGDADDRLNISLDAANLANAGTVTREDFNLQVNGGIGNDDLSVSIYGGLGNAQAPWFINHSETANVHINAGEGDDNISTAGMGAIQIHAGSGNDIVFTDNSAQTAQWVVNTHTNKAVQLANTNDALTNLLTNNGGQSLLINYSVEVVNTQAAHVQAENELVSAESNLNTAQTDLEAAQVSLETAQADLNNAHIEVNSTQTALDNARATSGVTSPEAQQAQIALDNANFVLQTATTARNDAQTAFNQANIIFNDTSTLFDTAHQALRNATVDMKTAELTVTSLNTALEPVIVQLNEGIQVGNATQSALTDAQMHIEQSAAVLQTQQNQLNSITDDLAQAQLEYQRALTSKTTAQQHKNDAMAEDAAHPTTTSAAILVETQAALDEAMANVTTADAAVQALQIQVYDAEIPVDNAHSVLNAAMNSRDALNEAQANLLSVHNTAHIGTEAAEQAATDRVVTRENELNAANAMLTNKQADYDMAFSANNNAQTSHDTAQAAYNVAKAADDAASTIETQQQLSYRTSLLDDATIILTHTTANLTNAETQLTMANNAQVIAEALVNAAQTELDARILDNRPASNETANAALALTMTAQELLANAQAAKLATAVEAAQLNVDLTAAEQNLANAETLLANATAHLPIAEANKVAAEAVLAIKQGDLTSLNTDLTNAEQVLTAAEATLVTKQGDLDTAMTALSNAQADLATKQNALSVIQADEVATSALLTTENTNLTTAQTALTTAQADLASAQASKVTADGNLVTASASLVTATNNLVTAETNLANAQAGLAADEAALIVAQTDVTTKAATLNTAQVALSNLVSNLSPVTVNDLAAINTAEATVASAQTAFDAAVVVSNTVQNTLDTTNATITAETTAVSTAQAAIAAETMAVSTAQTAQATAQTAIDTANTAITGFQADITAANNAITSAQTVLIGLQADETAALAVVANAQTVETTAQTATNTAEQAKIMAETAVADATTAVNGLHVDINTAELAITDAEATIATAINDIETAHQNITTANDDITVATEARDAITTIIDAKVADADLASSLFNIALTTKNVTNEVATNIALTSYQNALNNEENNLISAELVNNFLVNGELTVNFHGLESAVTISHDTDFNSNSLHINQAIKAAINNDSVLSHLLVAEDGPANTLLVTSLIDGQSVTSDLSFSINKASTLSTEDLAAINSARGTAYATAEEALADMDVRFADMTDASNLFHAEFATAGSTNDAINGQDSLAMNANTVYGDQGDDLLVLSTDHQSQETVVFAEDFGYDTVVNFSTDINGADVLDFSALNGRGLVEDGVLADGKVLITTDMASVTATADTLIDAVVLGINANDANVADVYTAHADADAATSVTLIQVGTIDLADVAVDSLTAINFA